MNKIYIDYNNGRKYYAYKYKNDKVIYIPLNSKDIENFLKSISNQPIAKLISKENFKEIIFENGISIVVDKLNVLYPNHDEHDKYFFNILKKVREHVTNRNIDLYKKSLPKNHIPKVNRKSKNRFPTKRIMAGALSFAITVSLISGLLEKELAKADYIGEEKSITYTMPPKKETTVSNKNIEYEVTSPTIEVDLAFDDLTENGKLEQTIEMCASYLDPWIERYGLPKNLTYALVCQEYGLLDCTINSSGACGPMQLQVASFHNDNAIESCKIPVYENGKLTGEYDEFYIADARKLDDPRLVGKKYLVMQDLEDNFQIGCAVLRRCIDKYKNIFIAIDAYNKGLYCLSSICSDDQLEHYKNNLTDFSWINIIPNNKGENYGDKDYLYHVLRYLDTDIRGNANIEYYYNGELIKVDLNNTNVYNSELSR